MSVNFAASLETVRVTAAIKIFAAVQIENLGVAAAVVETLTVVLTWLWEAAVIADFGQ